MRLAIIVGHTARAGGAVNYRGESEYKFNSRVAAKMKDAAPASVEVKVFFVDRGFAAVARQMRTWKPDVSVELHFNSFSRKAYGCEILILGGTSTFSQNFEIADAVTDDLSTAFNLRERARDGVLVRTSGRGVGNLRSIHGAGVPVVLLVEPCFANFRTAESEAIFENENKYVKVLLESILKHGFDIHDDVPDDLPDDTPPPKKDCECCPC